MKKQLILICIALFTAFASFGQGSITGTLHACRYATEAVAVDSASIGGVWTSSNTIVATVAVTTPGSYHATVYAAWPGTTTITYTLGGSTLSIVSATFTVDPSPTDMMGLTGLCVGSSSIFTDAIPGGTWTSSDPSIATIDPVTGYITGVSPGTPDITYTISSGCSVTVSYLTITHTPTGAISGPATICTGSTVTYTNSGATGTWSSSDPATATIDATTGVASAVAPGTVSIAFNATGICGLVSIYDTVNVSTIIPAITLSGPSVVDIGSDITIAASVSGGTWSSSNTAVAIVSSAGVVSGTGAGTATITYSYTGCSGVVTATMDVTVAAFDGISGHVLFSGSYSGPVRVWLITYDPITLDLEATDSVTISSSGGTSVYYQFTGLATDSFRVKATVSFDTSFTSTGYIPTYYTSSYYWHDASVIYHTTGTADINKDITMAVGSTSAGSGFIGGSVTTGANRGTSEGVPVPHLLVYAINSATGALAQQTYTNAAGNYAFTGLPYGTYLIHPELLNYKTVPYSNITLSSGSTTMSLANFIAHTLSHVIAPVSVGVKNVQPGELSVVVFPNPASDKLNLVWNETTTETGNVNLADMTGRQVYKTTISMKAGMGASQLPLPALADGSYIFTIKSANISYSNKIEIQH